MLRFVTTCADQRNCSSKHLANASWVTACPQDALRPGDSWVFDELADCGYRYDSSLAPFFRRYHDEPWRRFPHQVSTPRGVIWEYPPSTWKFAGLNLPIAGGNYFRQLPQSIVQRGFARWQQETDQPFLMYFHVWELDSEQPRISAAGPLTRLRHYRNLGNRMESILERYFSEHQFGTIAEHLEQQRTQIAPPGRLVLPTCHVEPRLRVDAGLPAARQSSPKTPISVVIPCFNEEHVLPHLKSTLDNLDRALSDNYVMRFLFVNDGSRDRTQELLAKFFGRDEKYTLIQHERNLGIAAAIATGIKAAKTDIVCSIDCDCSYDPLELCRMIPLLTNGVDMVVASPYHPSGCVTNVHRWRLVLSKTLSALYRFVLAEDLHTYTSCFRVYRTSTVAGIEPREGGFLGVAELLARLSWPAAELSSIRQPWMSDSSASPK